MTADLDPDSFLQMTYTTKNIEIVANRYNYNGPMGGALLLLIDDWNEFVWTLQIARSLNLDGIVREGVYVMVGGPNYETVAELKMLRELGMETYLHIVLKLK